MDRDKSDGAAIGAFAVVLSILSPLILAFPWVCVSTLAHTHSLTLSHSHSLTHTLSPRLCAHQDWYDAIPALSTLSDFALHVYVFSVCVSWQKSANSNTRDTLADNVMDSDEDDDVEEDDDEEDESSSDEDLDADDDDDEDFDADAHGLEDSEDIDSSDDEPRRKKAKKTAAGRKSRAPREKKVKGASSSTTPRKKRGKFVHIPSELADLLCGDTSRPARPLGPTLDEQALLINAEGYRLSIVFAPHQNYRYWPAKVCPLLLCMYMCVCVCVRVYVCVCVCVRVCTACIAHQQLAHFLCMSGVVL